jgi:hypothetical protein
VVPDVNLSFQAPWNDDFMGPDANYSEILLGPFKYDVYIGLEPNVLTMTQILDDYSPATPNEVIIVDPCAGVLAGGTVYYWRVDINDLDPCNPAFSEGTYLKFRTWGFADDPYPSDEGTGEATTDLRWARDGYADSFNVYFGTDATAVNDATTSSGEYKGGSTGTWTDPCDSNIVRDVYGSLPLLDLLQTYYWRIDEVNSSVAIKGVVWSFSTEAHIDLEDFDSYANTDPELLAVWSNYVNGSDAEVRLITAAGSTLEGKSLELDHFSTNKSKNKWIGSWTEADVANLEGGTDWTVSGIRALVLNFLGKPGNQATANEKMWVEIEDTSSIVGLVLYDGNPSDVQAASWHEWNVDCNIFDACGVTLSAVSKIRIGFGGEVRTGQSAASLAASQVYFDELELHPRRCAPVKSLPYGDLDGDCNVGAYDLQVMAGDWVVKDYQVFPAPPDRNDLLVEYLFDTDSNYNDTSGNGYHGQKSTTLTHVASGYLTIESEGGYVDIPLGASNPFDGSQDVSIFITYKSDTVTGGVVGEEEGGMVLITSADPCLPTDWEDPNFDTKAAYYSPMMVYAQQAHSGGPSSPDDFLSAFDYWYIGGTSVEKTGVLGGIGSWHNVAATYDADGGTCPSDADPNICTPGQPTGLLTAYFDGVRTTDQAHFDPNVPDITDEVVRIGSSISTIHMEDLGVGAFLGDINDIRIYDVVLSEAEVYYLGGVTDPTYVANTSVANLVPKSPPGGPYDANNPDIINFFDYEKLAQNWLTGPYLWP